MALFDPKPQPAPKPKGTRLAHVLRELKFEDELVARKAQVFATNLDHTAASLGAKGARVKTLSAYRQAAAFYRLQTGKDFR